MAKDKTRMIPEGFVMQAAGIHTGYGHVRISAEQASMMLGKRLPASRDISAKSVFCAWTKDAMRDQDRVTCGTQVVWEKGGQAIVDNLMGMVMRHELEKHWGVEELMWRLNCRFHGRDENAEGAPQIFEDGKPMGDSYQYHVWGLCETRHKMFSRKGFAVERGITFGQAYEIAVHQVRIQNDGSGMNIGMARAIATRMVMLAESEEDSRFYIRHGDFAWTNGRFLGEGDA